MKKILTLVVVMATILTFGSCGGGDGENEGGIYPEYLPFQSEEDGKWGLLGIDGKVLFADKFDNEPSEAYNGRFFVMNGDGLYEIYTAEAEPSRVGDKAYKRILPFYSDVTPAVESGKPVTIINKDGDVVATLDKIDGVKVISVDAFYDGLAVFHLSNELCGCIDTDGKVVIQPEYNYINYFNEGKFVAAKYYSDENTAERLIQYVLDHSGKVLFEKSVDEYQIVSPFNDGRAIVMIESNKYKYGIINEKGEIVVTDTEKRVITETKGDQYLCSNYGKSNIICSPNGEEIQLHGNMYHFTSEDGILVNPDYIYDVNGKEDHKYIGNLSHYRDLHNGYFLAKQSDKYIIVDKNDKRIDEGEGFYHVVATEKTYRNKHNPTNEPTVTNDVFDATAMIEPLQIGNEILSGIYLGMTTDDYLYALQVLCAKPYGTWRYKFEHSGYNFIWQMSASRYTKDGASSDDKLLYNVEVCIDSPILIGNQDKAKSAVIEAFKKAGWKYKRIWKDRDVLTFEDKAMFIGTSYNKEISFASVNIEIQYTQDVLPSDLRESIEN